MSPVNRRSFIKGMAIASAAAAGTAAAPNILGAAEPENERSRALTWRKTPCRLCGVGCGLLVGIQDGRAVAVKGDPESPVNKGLACVKGYYGVQALYARDRITRALVRRNGVLTPVPLSEALDIVAGKIGETIKQHGADGVALYGSAQWTIADAFVASRLFRDAIGTKNVDTSARLYSASGIAGLESTFGMAGAPGSYDDIDQADVFVLWNSNLAETDPVLFSRMLDRKRTNPAVRIIDVSTRMSRTGYAADQTLLYTPNSEIALANAISQSIVAMKSANRQFVDRYVALKRGPTDIGHHVGDDALVHDSRADASWDEYVSFLADYTPERAQRESGVPAESIRWLASLYADRSRKVMSVWGTGVNQHARGVWLNNALHNIHLLVGKVASPGNGALVLTEQPGVTGGVRDASAPANGSDALSMFRALDRGDIRFLWIQATNPMASLPNAGRYRVAARKEGRFIVVSEAYPTATTEVADVVLPAAIWMERDGIFMSGERRVQHFEQMVEAPGDATSDASQMIEVARRLGFGKRFGWDRDHQLGLIWDEYRAEHANPRQSMPPLGQLRARAGVRWPYVTGAETKWRYNTAHDPAADRTRGDFDFYGHADHRAWIWLRPQQPGAEAPDNTYPFWLSIGAVQEHWGTGTMTRRIPTLDRAAPRAWVEINRDDAKRLGISNRERVRLVSRRGSLEVEARIDFRAQPPRGQLFVPSFDERTPVNLLTLDAACPISGQPDYGTCAVRVERLGQRSTP